MSFFRDAALTFALQAVAAALQLVANVLLARGLGPDGRGVYELLTLLPTIAVYVASLGFGNAAMLLAAKEPRRAGAAAGSSMAVAAAGGIATALLIACFFEPLRAFIGGGCSSAGLWLALAAIPVLALELHSGLFLTGQQQIQASNVAKTAQVALALAGTGALFAVRSLAPTNAVAVWALSFAIGGALAWRMAVARIAASDGGGVRVDRAVITEGMTFGLRFFAGNLALFLLFRVDLWFVRHFRDLAEVGIYGQATKLAVLFQMSARAIERAFVPRILKASAAEANELTPKVARCFVLVMSAAALALGALAFPCVPLLFGERFAPAAAQLAWLLPGIVVANVGILANGDLISRGMPSAGSLAAVVALAANCALNVYVIPRHGALGAAFTSGVCYAGYGLAMGRHYAKVTGTRVSELFVPRGEDARAVIGMVTRARGGR